MDITTTEETVQQLDKDVTDAMAQIIFQLCAETEATEDIEKSMMMTGRVDTVGESQTDQEAVADFLAATAADPAVEADPLELHSAVTDIEGAQHHTISTQSPLHKTAKHPTTTHKTNQVSQLSSTNLPHQYLHHLPLSLHSAIQKIQMTKPPRSA